jgi:hypothetical protein
MADATRCVPLSDDERSVVIVIAAAICRKATLIAIENDTTVEEMLASIITREVGRMKLVSEVSDV